MKKLHRLMVTSKAYRRASCPHPEEPALSIDSDDAYLWRMNERRMEGEVIRDSLLSLAGRLDSKIGGPSLPVAEAAAGNRRTIYYRYAREPVDKTPVVLVFDAPNVEECFRRQETIVPQHSLMMMNSAMSWQSAREINDTIERQLPVDLRADDVAFVTAAFERVLGRKSSDKEAAACQAALEQFERLSPKGQGAKAAAARAREALVHVLLNHNDFISIR